MQWLLGEAPELGPKASPSAAVAYTKRRLMEPLWPPTRLPALADLLDLAAAVASCACSACMAFRFKDSETTAALHNVMCAVRQLLSTLHEQ